MVFAIIFSWLKMAEVCKSPFDGYKYYDIDLIKELDVNIWIASVSLEDYDLCPLSN